MINSFLRRLGRKNKILDKLLPYFPPHEAYVEPFFGSGSVFMNKPRATYNFLNDLDENVIKSFEVVTDKKDFALLIDFIENLPVSKTMWDRIKDAMRNKTYDSKIKQVAYFLYQSSLGYMGLPNTMKVGLDLSKKNLEASLKKAHKELCKSEMYWGNADFEDFFKSIAIRKSENRDEIDKFFCYCDSPYLNTDNNYETPNWKKDDLVRLVEANIAKRWRFAISEFENPTLLELVKENGLFLHNLGERRNLKKRTSEVLVTNYEVKLTLF